MVAIRRYMVSNCCGSRVMVASFPNRYARMPRIVLCSVNNLQSEVGSCPAMIQKSYSGDSDSIGISPRQPTSGRPTDRFGELLSRLRGVWTLLAYSPLGSDWCHGSDS